ncbi:uncharacterized protein LOC126657401 [Mercurialis annua]|uniref:uncharacterized protein LOC126657401 n=1 Tax=Mercurialis annua TaxID=3986 RepID=UPI002160CD6A|nr:uncharacterized protein LOC126657401 [Mercurialis annua]
MGACKAPICNLQVPSAPVPRISGTTARRTFLFSLPLIASSATLSCSTVAGSSSLGLAAESYDPLTQAEKDASQDKSRRISEAIQLLDKGREFQAQGDFNSALLYFTLVIDKYKDFAFSEYARVGRALALYEVGDKQEAIAEMEDVSISLKGYPEVHAALAAALYVDKHSPLLAENQFTIATLLDPHYTDLSYVKETKHWPPSLVSSLRRFITFS